ncbi:hypothetical protein K458DRAFT_434580 [Lentithecium fluviatile CBS 122367]|uniref:Uncharacterized protein n=1 Tax=Lentithecium fluviatile CBS 122367 TaxID=1168545 RepID=A0A6G1IQ22_9PLEO|nr:hypothetical protein K458DRAFT_434580 [Lentithecium fluviatile CBS 122367]
MAVRLTGALFILILSYEFIILTQAQSTNATIASQTPTPTPIPQAGWRKNPTERGSFNILWSCLTTIITCTWTVLHLNVPSYSDSATIKIFRKVKWMAIAIIFPEVVLSKAVLDLQYAMADLLEMKRLELRHKNCTKYEKEYADPDKTEEALLDEEDESNHGEDQAETSREYVGGRSLFHKSHVWTLTHSYFANMGGLVRWRRHETADYEPVTARAVVNCCYFEDHEQISSLSLSKEEIKDKAKADWVAKAIAILQIFWLLTSVITRLPIGANLRTWKYPLFFLAGRGIVPPSGDSDLDQSYPDGSNSDAEADNSSQSSNSPGSDEDVGQNGVDEFETCTAHYYYGDSFLSRMLTPSSNIAASRRVRSRISNGSIRFAHTNRDNMTYSLFAYASVVYGILHSLSKFSFFQLMVFGGVDLMLILTTRKKSPNQSYVLADEDMPENAMVYKYGLVYAIARDPPPVDQMRSLHRSLLAAYPPMFGFMCRWRDRRWRDCTDFFDTILQARRDWNKLLLQHGADTDPIDLRLDVETSEYRVIYLDEDNPKAHRAPVLRDSFVRMPWKDYQVLMTNLITNTPVTIRDAHPVRAIWAEGRRSWSLWERFW